MGDFVLGAGVISAVLTFALAVLKIFGQDRVWKDLNDTIREELEACRKGREEQRRAHAAEREAWREERGRLEVKVQTLEGELIALRHEVHRDEWLGDRERRETEGGR